jgi:hypothetical protein
MAHGEERDDPNVRVPEHMIEAINKLDFASDILGNRPRADTRGTREKAGHAARKSAEALRNRQATDQVERDDRRPIAFPSRLILRADFASPHDLDIVSAVAPRLVKA